jgi:hypothetical protein
MKVKTTIEQQDQLLEIYILLESGKKIEAVERYAKLKDIKPVSFAVHPLLKEYELFNRKKI